MYENTCLICEVYVAYVCVGTYLTTLTMILNFCKWLTFRILTVGIWMHVIQISPHIRSSVFIHYLFKRPGGQRTVLCDLCSLRGLRGMLGTSCIYGQSYSWALWRGHLRIHTAILIEMVFSSYATDVVQKIFNVTQCFFILPRLQERNNSVQSMRAKILCKQKGKDAKISGTVSVLGLRDTVHVI